MKTYVKIALFIIMFILLLGIKGVKAHDEFTKVIKKEFPITSDGQLTISNRFGKVLCTNWEKNAISFDITITVTAADQEEAGRMFKRISVDFTDSPAQITAITSIQEGRPRGHGSFSVDYTVNMPVTINLDLTNKFGDIFVNEVQGKAKINLGYGNLEAKKLTNSDNMLDIRFSKANINWVKGAVLILKYSEMELDYAGSLRLDSKFSNMDANKIIALNVNFEGGKLNMENSSAVDSKSKFSDLEIQRIEKSLNLDIQYGSCEVHEMPPDFTLVNIRNKYGNVSIGLGEQAKYNLEADLKFCDLDYPTDKAKFSFRSTSPTEKSFKGIIGGTDNPTGKVTVHSEFGNVSLK
ncbi:MAG: DUF4097 family beta strand repeat-containing protein [Bacteroidales bacterium]|jgi:hypothetical protein|nr:DUF4097 family beta strand repeat-containing protein [Bacteroidales bacterium]